MDFKGLIDHYETLPKSELIEKLVGELTQEIKQLNERGIK